MSDDADESHIPDLAAGFVRLGVLVRDPAAHTPGAVARTTGLGPDELGPVLVIDHQLVIDVAEPHVDAVRERLEALGPVQIVAREPRSETWSWLRIEVGRNHGLTLQHLRKVLDRHRAGQLGRIHVNNTHSLVGLRDDRLPGVVTALADARLNGVRVRPRVLDPGEQRESPAYQARRGR